MIMFLAYWYIVLVLVVIGGFLSLVIATKIIDSIVGLLNSRSKIIMFLTIIIGIPMLLVVLSLVTAGMMLMLF